MTSNMKFIQASQAGDTYLRSQGHSGRYQTKLTSGMLLRRQSSPGRWKLWGGTQSGQHNRRVKPFIPYTIRVLYGLWNKLLRVTSSFTEKQGCHPTQVRPGEVCKWANVLHVCKIQDDWHEADENKVGAADDAQEERRLSKFGTAQHHLEEHLGIKEKKEMDVEKSTPPFTKLRVTWAKYLPYLWLVAAAVCLS